MKDSGGYLDGRKRESVYILLYTICPTEFTTKFTMALLTDSHAYCTILTKDLITAH